MSGHLDTTPLPGSSIPLCDSKAAISCGVARSYVFVRLRICPCACFQVHHYTCVPTQCFRIYDRELRIYGYLFIHMGGLHLWLSTCRVRVRAQMCAPKLSMTAGIIATHVFMHVASESLDAVQCSHGQTSVGQVPGFVKVCTNKVRSLFHYPRSGVVRTNWSRTNPLKPLKGEQVGPQKLPPGGCGGKLKTGTLRANHSCCVRTD